MRASKPCRPGDACVGCDRCKPIDPGTHITLALVDRMSRDALGSKLDHLSDGERLAFASGAEVMCALLREEIARCPRPAPTPALFDETRVREIAREEIATALELHRAIDDHLESIR